MAGTRDWISTVRWICAAGNCRAHDGVDRGAANALYFDLKTGEGAIAFANANDPSFQLSYGVNDIVEHRLLWFE